MFTRTGTHYLRSNSLNSFPILLNRILRWCVWRGQIRKNTLPIFWHLQTFIQNIENVCDMEKYSNGFHRSNSRIFFVSFSLQILITFWQRIFALLPLAVSFVRRDPQAFPDGNQPPAAPCKLSSSFPNVYRKLVTIKL